MSVRLYDSCMWFPLESRCGKGTAIENEVIREEMKKLKNNRTAAPSKLDKTFPCLFLFVFRFTLCFTTRVLQELNLLRTKCKFVHLENS